jgi:citrate synthase
MENDSLSLVDHRTNCTHQLSLCNGNITAADLRKIKKNADDFGVMSYDPAFMNTASCQSRITFIDGDKGILRYRGYNIEDLAEKCSYLEVAHLLLYGELPNDAQLRTWVRLVTRHSMLHESTKKFLEGFRYDAHPMGMFISTIAALSTVYPEAKHIDDCDNRKLQIARLIAKAPTVAAYAYRHNFGLPSVYPDNDLTYTENFMNMLWRMVEPKYVADPILARALEILFILHADHEQNCSTTTMRVVGSAHTDPYLCVAAAVSALAGPLHGKANNEEVLLMLDEIGTKERIPAFIQQVKEGQCKLMGFGHRVYKNYDPRARIIKRTAEQVFSVTGRNPKLDIALELERITHPG